MRERRVRDETRRDETRTSVEHVCESLFGVGELAGCKNVPSEQGHMLVMYDYIVSRGCMSST